MRSLILCITISEKGRFFEGYNTLTVEQSSSKLIALINFLRIRYLLVFPYLSVTLFEEGSPEIGVTMKHRKGTYVEKTILFIIFITILIFKIT